MVIEHTNGGSKELQTQPKIPDTSYPALKIDYSKYDEFLTDVAGTPEEKREFLDAFWSIVVAFVDLGTGLHPTQQIDANSCERNGDKAELDLTTMVEYLCANQSEGEADKQQCEYSK